MHISFTHPSKAFLPEIEAYSVFFKKYGIKTSVAKFPGFYNEEVDVEWYFMGMFFKKNPGVVTIHEYTSASVPPFPKIKNQLKKMLAIKPDCRIFLNDFVQKQFSFADKIPSCIRDMGVDAIHRLSIIEKEYDFIYIGTVESKRKLDGLFECFGKGSLQNRTLLVLTTNYHKISHQMKEYNNIRFEGPVPHKQVLNYLQKAKFGINYVPDIHPYNQQTSTKLLEYVAAGIPVITNQYAWVEQFEKKYGGNFFKIAADFSNFNWKNITEFSYKAPDLTDWIWEKQISKSGILQFLESRMDQKSIDQSGRSRLKV